MNMYAPFLLVASSADPLYRDSRDKFIHLLEEDRWSNNRLFRGLTAPGEKACCA